MANFKLLKVLRIGMQHFCMFGSSELVRVSSSILVRETQSPSKVGRLIKLSPYEIGTSVNEWTRCKHYHFTADWEEKCLPLFTYSQEKINSPANS